MKPLHRYLIPLALFLWISMLNTQLTAQELDIMTFNIRYANQKDGADKWEFRKDDVVDLISNYNPQAFGIQEGLHKQVLFLQEHLPSYKMIGVGRDDGASKGEYSSIFYDTSRLLLLEEGTFWLSPTPEKVSVGWDAAMERICTYGLFEDKINGKKLFIYNTHFDHLGEQARINSAALILKTIAKKNINDYPVVLMGDLNSRPGEAPIELISQHLKDPIASIDLYGPTGTWNEFDTTSKMDERIDYIFIKGFEVTKYRHIDDRRTNGRMVSDHLPVLITINSEFR